MRLPGHKKYLRLALLVSNVLMMVGGIAAFAVGLQTCIDIGYLKGLLGSDLYMSSANALIVMGIAIIIISFLGFLGTIREIKFLMLSYLIALFIIFVVLVNGGMLGYVFRSKVKETISNSMMIALRYDYGVNLNIKNSWDTLQEQMKCCGMVTVESKKPFNEWKKNEMFMAEGSPRVPLSCCLKNDDGHYVDEDKCQNNPTNLTVYDKDCSKAAVNFVQGQALILGCVGVGIGCLMIIGMIFSCMFIHAY